MPLRLVSRATIAGTALIASTFVAACGGVAEPATDAARTALDVSAISSPEGRLYVLTGSTGQRSEIVATADITCDDVRTRVTVQDSITLWSDGRVLRVGVLRSTRNDSTTYDGRSENRGTWRTYATTQWDFYNEAPGIVLLLDARPGERYEWYLRSTRDGGFSTRQALGARCSARTTSATNDPPRTEEFFYTPR